MPIVAAPSRLADWTVDRLLSSFKMVNARAESAQNTLRANRSRFYVTLKQLPTISDPGVREALRAKLSEWIHGQVAAENKYQDFSQRWEHVKSAVKRFLQDVGITPPVYLGVGPVLAPIAVAGLVAAALALVTVVIIAASNQAKALDCISNVTTAAVRKGWTAEETNAALRSCRAATDSAAPDPLGLARTLQAALPVALVIGAIMLLGPAMRRRGLAT